MDSEFSLSTDSYSKRGPELGQPYYSSSSRESDETFLEMVQEMVFSNSSSSSLRTGSPTTLLPKPPGSGNLLPPGSILRGIDFTRITLNGMLNGSRKSTIFQLQTAIARFRESTQPDLTLQQQLQSAIRDRKEQIRDILKSVFQNRKKFGRRTLEIENLAIEGVRLVTWEGENKLDEVCSIMRKIKQNLEEIRGKKIRCCLLNEEEKLKT